MGFIKSKYFLTLVLLMFMNGYYHLVIEMETLQHYFAEYASQFVILIGIFFYMYNSRKFLKNEKKELKKEKRVLQEKVSIMKEVVENLNVMAMYDDLTGLPNVRLFMNKLKNRLTSYHEYNRPKDKCVVFYIDLNNFKEVNDTMGHEAGNETLQEVANRLKNCVRPNDTVARIGGDEFAVLISGEVSASKVMARMKKQFPIHGIPISSKRRAKVGISLGAIRFSDDMTSAEELMNAGDRAMYFAKFQCRQSSLMSGTAWSDGLGSKIPS